MEELLKMAYWNFLNENDESNSKEVRIINKAQKGIDEELYELREILSDKLFDKVYDKITESVSDIQEANFIAGFAYCAKFLTNGKTDLFPNI